MCFNHDSEDQIIMLRICFTLIVSTLAVFWHAEAKPTVSLTKKAKTQSMKGKGSPSKRSKKIKGILVGGAGSTDLEILSCDSTSVTIQGIASVNVTKGSFFINVGDEGDLESCSSCAPLFRKVLSVSVAPSGTKTLKTAFATMGELFDETLLNQAFKMELIEPLAGCSHSGVTTGTKVVRAADSTKKQLVASEGDQPAAPASTTLSAAAADAACDALWQLKNADGRCTHTNCFVGTTGNPIDCFKCKTTCNNGCGAAGSFLNTDGNFITFDFGPACCNHDFCWSTSSFTKDQCDLVFYGQMKSQCNPFAKSVSFFRRLGRLTPASIFSCHTLASAFFLAVRSSIGKTAYKTAQDEQTDYETTEDVCVAKCPTTQRSGGQGVTTLTIDLLKTSGTFPVSYQMYTIPDELTIVYEGQQIFSTGGLVSGGTTANVNFAGASTKIQVTINAPNSGTAWDVFVGCPV
jgi:hypothetical protein